MGTVSKTVFITGINSFTGKYLADYLRQKGYKVVGSSRVGGSRDVFGIDIADKVGLTSVINQVLPDYVIHLAAISFVGYEKNLDFYNINTIGTINLLEALNSLKKRPKKVILASSAVVYGRQEKSVLDESLCPFPLNHYGSSKYAMETLAANFYEDLPILQVRPFNYTGTGQSENFLIPKIVKHFKEQKKKIELGNLDVVREFNDISFVCEVYSRLLESDIDSTVVNICSGRGISLIDIIDMMNMIAGYNIEVEVNQQFVRKNEIKKLVGSADKLFKIIGRIEQVPFDETLKNMYKN